VENIWELSGRSVVVFDIAQNNMLLHFNTREDCKIYMGMKWSAW
jgi:hypothetical protein